MEVKFFRVKTEKEFIATLGDNWRIRVLAGWDEQMSKTFGKIISKTNSSSVIKSLGWNYSSDMLVEVNEEETKELLKDPKNSYFAESVGTADFPIYKISNQKLEYFATFYIFFSPTGNCQVMSINPFNNFLSCLKRNQLDILEHVKAMVNCIPDSKKILLFDLEANWFEKIKNLPNIIIKNEYTSTNGSKMVLGLLKMI